MKKPLTPAEVISLAAAAGVGPREVVNTRSAAFRKLHLQPVDDERSASLISEEPRVMIRPVLAVDGGDAVFGFDEAAFEDLVAGLPG